MFRNCTRDPGWWFWRPTCPLSGRPVLRVRELTGVVFKMTFTLSLITWISNRFHSPMRRAACCVAGARPYSARVRHQPNAARQLEEVPTDDGQVPRPCHLPPRQRPVEQRLNPFLHGAALSGDRLGRAPCESERRQRWIGGTKRREQRRPCGV